MAAAALAELGITLDPTDDLFLSPPTLPSSLTSSKSSPTPDLYSYLKHLEREHEFVRIQSEYVKDEQKNLKKEWQRAKEEVKRIQSVPLVIGQFLEIIDLNTGIVTATTGQTYYVRILSTINREQLKPNSSVALHRYSNSVVDVLPPEADSAISMMQMQEKPDVAYTDIGGLDIQKQEIREAVELPLTHFELYRQIGIDPPRGVLLWGPPGTTTHLRTTQRTPHTTHTRQEPHTAHAARARALTSPVRSAVPGTGKTMMAKAVAHHTTASFIRVVGSEFVQKYLGEGPRMVRDVFRMARENAPAIIFIVRQHHTH